MRSNFNRNKSDFDRNFDRMNNVFWVMFTVAAVLIVGVWAAVGVGVYTVVTNPEAIGNIAADVIRPVVDVIKDH